MGSQGICLVKGCDKPVSSKAMCRAHRQRWLRNGTTDPLRTSDNEPLRFLASLQDAPETGDCIIWPYSCGGDGYGRVRINGHRRVASRVVCEQKHGPAPSPRHQAAHSCGKGNIGCVAPYHLDWSTPEENQQDRVLHGTTTRGERNGRAILTADNVVSIRREFSTGTITKEALAVKYGVSATNIRHVINRNSWFEIP